MSSSGLISLIRGHSDLQQLNAGYSFPVGKFFGDLVIEVLS